MKKFTILKITLIVLLLLAMLIAGLIVAYTYQKVEMNQYGLNYNLVSGMLNQNITYQPGIYYSSISHQFLKIIKTPQIIEFKNLYCLTSDIILVNLNMQIAYQINFSDPLNLTNYYVNFGNNPSDYFKPIFKSRIQNIFSTFTLNTLQNFNAQTFQSQLSDDLNNILSPLVSLNLTITTQSFSSNYQNRTTSTYLALLNQKINQLVSINSQLSNSSADYAYRINALAKSLQSYLDNRYNLEYNNVLNKFAMLNNSDLNNNLTGTIKLKDFLYANNQSYYQDWLMPQYYRNGAF